MKEQLINPVRRLEKPKVDIEIKPDNDDLINIKAEIKIKNPMTSIIKFINKQIKKR